MSQKSVNTHLALQEKLEGDSRGTLCGDRGTRKSNPECNFAPQEQPAPVPNDSPAIWPLVIADMRARDQLGRARYGTPLQAHNGRDALRDAYEEALDLVVYLRQAIAERDGHEPPPAAPPMPDNRCATCKHYYPPESTYDNGYGTCGLAGSMDGKPWPETLAYASDAESYSASLRVKPEFGCVQWGTVYGPVGIPRRAEGGR